MKVVVHLAHPTMSVAEIAVYERDILIELGKSRVAAKMQQDFQQIELEGKSNGVHVLADGTLEVYPKMHFEAVLKEQPPRDINTALDEVLVDWVSALEAQLAADGFTFTVKKANF